MRDTRADGIGQTSLHNWDARPGHGQDADRRSFALWAPSLPEPVLEIDNRRIPMQHDAQGVHRCVADAHDGSPNRFLCQEVAFADPASPWQPDGVEGPSQRLSDTRLGSRKARRTPPAFSRQVISELHIATFTQEGTFVAAARATELRRMADRGITAIEIMPLGQFPGEPGWRYDVVRPYAPHHSYGPPDDLASLIDTPAHQVEASRCASAGRGQDHVTHLFEPGSGLCSARWVDDYHHALHVLLTGETFGYYNDFRHAPLSDLALYLRDGQALQGQPRPGQEEPVRAPSAHLPAPAYVTFNLNHHHAGNPAPGEPFEQPGRPCGRPRRPRAAPAD